MTGLSYLSGRLDQRRRAETWAAGGPGLLYPLQEDSGPGDVTPRHAQAGLQLPAASSCYVVRHLQGPDTSCLGFFCFDLFPVALLHCFYIVF